MALSSQFYINRVVSFMVDVAISCILTILAIAGKSFAELGVRTDYPHAIHHFEPLNNFGFLIILGIMTFFLKDLYNGRSVGKRIADLAVTQKNSNHLASPVKLVIRNLTLLLAPLEFAFVYLNPHRRIGDYLAATQVVSRSSLKVEKYGWQKKNIAGAVLLSSVLSILIFLPTYLYKIEFESWVPQIEQQSYNAGASNELEQHFNEQIKNSQAIGMLKADIEVYNEVHNYGGHKYVSIFLEIKEEMGHKEVDVDQYIQKCETIVRDYYMGEAFIARVKGHYESPGTNSLVYEYINID